jgi:hypothetical protein
VLVGGSSGITFVKMTGVGMVVALLVDATLVRLLPVPRHHAVRPLNAVLGLPPRQPGRRSPRLAAAVPELPARAQHIPAAAGRCRNSLLMEPRLGSSQILDRAAPAIRGGGRGDQPGA